MAEYHFDTLKIRAAYDPALHNQAVSPPIYQTASYEFRDTKNADGLFAMTDAGFLYSRINNPTVDVLERRVAALDGGSGALALGSGMAAIAYTILTLAEGGGRILTSPYLYGGSSDAFKRIFPNFNIHIDQSPDFGNFGNTDNIEALEKSIKDDTKAIFVESVSNPLGVVADIEALAKLAHKHNIPLVVDNTFATPYLLNPIAYGADIVIYSATKALNGHGNAIAGIIVESGRFPWNNGKFPQLEHKEYVLRDRASGVERNFLEAAPDAPFVTRIRLTYLNYFGAALGPFDAYLALIGIETLSERLDKQVSNAKKLASWLEKNPHVAWVKYAGLPSNPYHKLAQKYFPKGVPGIFSFGFKGTVEQSEAFLNAIELWSYHVNVGDARSLIVNSPKTTHGELTPAELKVAGIEPNLIRLSLGLEDPDDLIADLDQAFKKVF
ncbi:MAG: aminotransferase class I/II-fold pyridoxal phosphate-dependent enzyme [Spirochaetaceae bacterium]|jgi:O-acetylhomoserine (thiol)-lyase|nr:aminotransferase class I/II-fold pyridoxal phosphate-dependent enzyme [Spirochaetaceae bacterium]